MIAEKQKGRIDRILVALDDSSKAIDLLHKAAKLADELDAELVGLFVEDIDLLKAADLPNFREVNLVTRTRRKINRNQIERILQEREIHIRSELERIGLERQLKVHLRIARGTVAAEIQKAAADADLIIMSRSTMSSKRLGSTARRIAGERSCNLLLIGPSQAETTQLLTIYDGTVKARRAMRTAASLADARGVTLTIVIAGESSAAAEELQAEAAGWLHEQGILAQFRWLLPPESKKLAEIIGREGRCMLILPDESKLVEKGKLSEILPDLKCPVFLVR